MATFSIKFGSWCAWNCRSSVPKILGERTSGIPSSLMAVVVGGVLLCVSLGLVLVAASLALLRFGLPLDLSFLIVAVVAIVISLILVRSGVGALKPSRLVPAKSISEILDHCWRSQPELVKNRVRSSEYEAQANRLRAQIGARVDALQSELTPSNLASEAASRIGMADLSWGGAFDYASKRASGSNCDHRTWRSIMDDVCGPKPRQTRSACGYDGASKRLDDFDSSVRDKSVSGASRGKTSRVC